MWGGGQRRSQESLAGGADRIPGGGINLNTYSYGKRDRQPRGGGSKFSRGAEPPSPPVATGLGGGGSTPYYPPYPALPKAVVCPVSIGPYNYEVYRPIRGTQKNLPHFLET